MEHYEQEVIRESESSHPVELKIPHPENPSRGLALATLLFMIPKMILAIPHIIVLYFLGVVGIIVAIFAQLVVLITGRYPHSLFKIVKGVFQWQIRVSMFILGLTDKYPPFSFH